MKKGTLLFLVVSSLIWLVACAATYKPSTIKPQNVVETVEGSKKDLCNAAKRALILEGFRISSFDDDAGIISTGPKQMDLDETHCDCGTTMGIPYIKDKRTITTVSLGLIIDENRINAKATIEGEYLKGHETQSVSMVCVSTGEIERDLIQKIKAQF